MADRFLERSHRLDVDGLRALAVLSVIAYHLFPRVLPGGFVGVDIFFVISGFVVTLSILGSATGDAGRDLLAFWRRRLLRIFPMVAVVTFVCMILAAAFVAPADPGAYNAIFRSGIASLLGLANVYLYRGTFDYFLAADNSTNVFLHMWSLGVEEQFYLLFAILFIAVPAMARPASAPRALRIASLWSLTVLSFAFAAMNARTNPASAFFLLQNRFWELGIGSALAIHGVDRPFRRGPLAQGLAAIMLIAALALPAALLSLPLHRVVIATSASAALIATNANGLPWLTRSLTNRGSVYVGRISYSLYLWHWPIFVILRITVGLHHAATIALALIVLFVLSALSHRYVEEPIRRSSKPFLSAILPKAAFAFAASCFVGTLAQVYAGAMYLGQRGSWGPDWQAPRDRPYLGGSLLTVKDCDLMNGRDTVPARLPAACTSEGREKGTGRPRLLLIGDSHAYALWGMGAYEHDHGPFALSSLALEGCSIASDDADSCSRYWALTRALVREMRPGDAVLVSVLWPFGPEPVSSVAKARIEELARIAKTGQVDLIVEAPPPQFDRSAVTCSPEWFRADYEGCSMTRASLEMRRAPVMQLLRDVTRAYSNARIWDPADYICPNQVCGAFEGGRPLFRDYNHFSYFGARSLGPAFVGFLRSNRDPAGAHSNMERSGPAQVTRRLGKPG